MGNCGGTAMPDVLKYYNMNVGTDNMGYEGSPEEKLWNTWQSERSMVTR
jgi:phenol/toluene 2-monooxygenase (NADH) P3/A3